MITSKESKEFELVLQIRDHHGDPTGRTKSYKTDSPYKLWKFYMSNSHKTKKKKRGERVPDKKEAEKILKTIYGDSQ